MLIETRKNQGADSFPALAVATVQRSTETTFYVLAVYFGAVGVQRTRHAVACASLAEFAGGGGDQDLLLVFRVNGLVYRQMRRIDTQFWLLPLSANNEHSGHEPNRSQSASSSVVRNSRSFGVLFGEQCQRPSRS